MPHPRKSVAPGTLVGGWEVLDTNAGPKNHTWALVKCGECGSTKETRLAELMSARPSKCGQCALDSRSIPIVDRETGHQYRSMREAARAFGKSQAAITMSFQGRGALKNRFYRLGESPEAPEQPAPPVPRDAVIAAFNGQKVMPLKELQQAVGQDVVSECFDFLRLEMKGMVRLLG